MPDRSPVWLSLQTAGLATCLVIPIGTVLAWWLAHGRSSAIKDVVRAALALPLVLPPIVVGYYLLLVFGRGTSLGRWVNDVVGLQLMFTWQGAAVAAAVMALPLYTIAASAALAEVDQGMLEAGRTLGADEIQLALKVVVPIAYRGLLAGATLAFARALGEFGATLMVAGSIPGRTQTLPLALYAAVIAGKEEEARRWTAILSALAIGLVGSVAIYQRHVAASRGERRR